MFAISGKIDNAKRFETILHSRRNDFQRAESCVNVAERSVCVFVLYVVRFRYRFKFAVGQLGKIAPCKQKRVAKLVVEVVAHLFGYSRKNGKIIARDIVSAKDTVTRELEKVGHHLLDWRR